LDDMAEKPNLASSGCKANGLLAPSPCPRSPSRGQVFFGVGCGFGNLGGLRVENYLDGLAQKLNLTSSGCKAEMLFAPSP
jgi:hypothetical protein